VLALLAVDGRSMGALAATLPTLVNTPELRIDCPEERKFEVVAELRDRLRAAGAEVTDIDGVRVKTAEGWWLVRASNTQAALVARAEARDERALKALRAAMEDALAKSGVAIGATASHH
jgi:phosphomannomutase